MAASIYECPNHENLCINTCYNPEELLCLPDSKFKYNEIKDEYTKVYLKEKPWILCKLDQDTCGGQCFLPEAETCVHDSVILSPPKDILSPDMYACVKKQVCGLSCYDPLVHACSEGVRCLIDKEKTCHGKCIPVSKTCTDHVVSCDEEMLVCGKKCYDPKLQACVKGRVVDRKP